MDDDIRWRVRDSYLGPYARMLAIARSMVVILSLLFIPMALFTLVPSIARLLDVKAEVLHAQTRGLRSIPELEARLGDLEKRTKALTARDVEARLSRIETAIHLGQVDADELQSIQQLRDEVVLLKTFMFERPEQMVDFRILQRDYRDLQKLTVDVMPRSEILRELESTKSMYYWNLAIFGVLVSIFGGTWFVSFRQAAKRSSQEAEEPKANQV